MSLPKLLLEAANHVVDELLAEHLVLQAGQKPGFNLLPLNPQTVLANAVAALRVERTAILRPRSFRPAAHQCDAAATFATSEQSREQVNLLLLAAGKARTSDAPELLC